MKYLILTTLLFSHLTFAMGKPPVDKPLIKGVYQPLDPREGCTINLDLDISTLLATRYGLSFPAKEACDKDNSADDHPEWCRQMKLVSEHEMILKEKQREWGFGFIPSPWSHQEYHLAFSADYNELTVVAQSDAKYGDQGTCHFHRIE